MSTRARPQGTSSWVGPLTSTKPVKAGYWWVHVSRVDGRTLREDQAKVLASLGWKVTYSSENNTHMVDVSPQENFAWGRLLARDQPVVVPACHDRIQYQIDVCCKDTEG